MCSSTSRCHRIEPLPQKLDDRLHGFIPGPIHQLARIVALVKQLLAPIRVVADVEIIPVGERDQRSANRGRATLTRVGRIGLGELGDRPNVRDSSGDRSGRRSTPKTGQRPAGKRCPSDRPTRSTIVAGRSRRLTTSRTTASRLAARRQNDHERHADFRTVKTLPVLEQTVLAQFFAVIGGDDHQGSVELTALFEGGRTTHPGTRRDKRGSCRRSLEPDLDTSGSIFACRSLSSALPAA